MAIIKLKNITKRYGEKSVLKDFSLIVNEGDCKFCSNGTPILKSAVHSF